MRRFPSLFKRKAFSAPDAAPQADCTVDAGPLRLDPKAPVILPATVCDAIDAAHIVVQFSAQHEEPRVLFSLPGSNATIYSDEVTKKTFAEIFPELSECQLEKVIRRIDFRIVAAAQAKLNLNNERQAYSARIGGANWDESRIGRW